jgi:SAM-dependent methyltransferase
MKGGLTPSVLNRIRQYISKRKQFQIFRSEFWQFRAASDPTRFAVEWKDRQPCLDDRTSRTYFDRHYVYHTAWAARVLAKTKPAQHVDIGSYLYFAALVSAFVPVRFFDYRPAPVVLPGLETGFADLLALPFEDGSVSSLSCMHVVEHVGLGRYGDPLDPNGDLKAMKELIRVLAPGGDLLFVVPVGQPRVMFNAHRIYGYDQIMNAFDGLILSEFILIQSQGAAPPIAGASVEQVAAERYGCGCFHFCRPEFL